VDQLRFGIWVRRLAIDAAAKRAGDVAGDVTTLEWVRDRFAHTLPPQLIDGIRAQLTALRSAADSKDTSAAAAGADRLLSLLS
jgi:hypothetical protein